MEQTVTVVETHTDDAHCDRFGSIKCETWTYVVQCADMKVAGTDDYGYMPVQRKCLVELSINKLNCVRKLEAGASHLNPSGSVRTSQSGCCSEYHCLSLRWVQQQTILKKPMDDVISAVNQLRQTIRTLSLDSNVGLNIISFLVNTDMMLTGATYSENSKGPSTEPWGSPDSQGAVTDFSTPAATYCERPDTNDLSQSNAEPFIPKVC